MEERQKEVKTLNLVLMALALGTFAVAVWTVTSDKFKAGTDDLFLVLVCLMLSVIFAALPAKWAHDNGWFKAGDDEEMAEAHAGAADDQSHGASTKVFIYVWVALL